MENEEISKYLTEKMGECYHDWKLVEDTPPFRVYQCRQCDLEQINPDGNINFFTWQGFGMLWDWAIKQDWWWKFCVVYFDSSQQIYNYMPEKINPEPFALAIYNYLKESE